MGCSTQNDQESLKLRGGGKSSHSPALALCIWTKVLWSLRESHRITTDACRLLCYLLTRGSVEPQTQLPCSSLLTRPDDRLSFALYGIESGRTTRNFARACMKRSLRETATTASYRNWRAVGASACRSPSCHPPTRTLAHAHHDNAVLVSYILLEFAEGHLGLRRRYLAKRHHLTVSTSNIMINVIRTRSNGQVHFGTVHAHAGTNGTAYTHNIRNLSRSAIMP